jgi:hypothetical protein
MIYKITRLDSETTWGVWDAEKGKYQQKFGECSDKWVPALDARTGTRRTGLEIKLPERECKKLNLPEGSLLQHKYEKQLNLPEGTLSPNSDYWKEFMIIIPENGLELNDAVEFDEFRLALFRADKQIAKSFEESKLSTKFQYMITNDTAEAKVENTRRDAIANAYAKFAQMSVTEISEALYMFGKEPDDTSPEICRNTLGNILDNDPNKFLSIVGDERFNEKIKLIKMIKEGIIRKGASAVGWNVPLFFGDIPLGKGLDEAIDFLLDKENTTIYAGLHKAYEAAIKV